MIRAINRFRNLREIVYMCIIMLVVLFVNSKWNKNERKITFIVPLNRFFQFIILASAALCCTAFAYPVFEDYQYAGHDLSAHDSDNFDNGSYQPVASSRIGVHELGGHEDEHVDYYVCTSYQFNFQNIKHTFPMMCAYCNCIINNNLSGKNS